MSRWLTSAAVVVALALSLSTAHAGQYDGKWVFDFSAPNPAGSNQNPSCAGMRIIASVTDDQLTSSLARERNSPTEMTNSTGSGAAALSGTVTPDGTLTATWQGYEISGRLAGDGGSVNMTGECGPLVGKAMRVSE